MPFVAFSFPFGGVGASFLDSAFAGCVFSAGGLGGFREIFYVSEIIDSDDDLCLAAQGREPPEFNLSHDLIRYENALYTRGSEDFRFVKLGAGYAYCPEGYLVLCNGGAFVRLEVRPERHR